MRIPDTGKNARAPRCMRTFAAAAALGVMAIHGRAQSPESSSPADAFTAQGDLHPELQWGAKDKFDRVRFMNGFSTHIILNEEEPRPPPVLFFPPIPPLLESDIPVIAPLEPGPPAPEELSAFVGEMFYPFLATRLVTNDLARPMRAKLLAYRDTKVALQYELRSRIAALKDAGPAQRAYRLSVLAAQEAPRLAALTATAERIRSDLRERNVFGLQTDSHDTKVDRRLWVRSAAERPSDAAGLLKESEAVMDAAFYQDGLSPDERSLLVEAAVELRTRAVPPTGQEQPGTRILDFSPSTARIRIPADLGPQMEERIGDYIRLKDSLKSELLDTLRRKDETSEPVRIDILEKLAVSQEPRFESLQVMAEDIRVGLGALPNPPGPPVPLSLPPDLSGRISLYRAHKVALLKTLRSMLAAPARSAGQPAADRDGKIDDPVSGALAWLHDGTTSTEIQSTSLRGSYADFDRMQAELIAQINSEEAGIRESLASYVRASNAPSDRKSVNDLLRDFEAAREREEVWEQYRDYQTAVLMPGLSGAQRQLLFDAGVRELNLPLPTGERVN